MNITITILDKNIKVLFEEHIVRITLDDELTGLLKQNTQNITAELVTKAKTNYYQIFNKDFDVSDESMIVEIWAHVYVEKFAEILKSLSLFHIIDSITNKIIERCEVIDIGEHGYDDNRFVWNSLSHFKSAIALLLPK